MKKVESDPFYNKGTEVLTYQRRGYNIVLWFLDVAFKLSFGGKTLPLRALHFQCCSSNQASNEVHANDWWTCFLLGLSMHLLLSETEKATCGHKLPNWIPTE